ncbi:putative alpha/beta hydrolase [Mycobacterium camsae]|uniref:putative alpha/beta hydrolase n=1 Tax=Mycobacterium gordonae TaxID=1778 RepID=UPI0019820D23|nr:hypothetical protein [Mycobacterium gordonae]
MLLVDEAGGDPWAINGSLQRGRPAPIAALAKAFHDAGQLTREAESAFSEARRRFEAAWNRENGDNPINDAAEVQRATSSLGVQAGQLPQIAVDLESVAAVLAESQRAAAGRVHMLEIQLEAIDRQLGEAHSLLNSRGLPLTQEMALDDVINDLEQHAIGATTAALREIEHIREMYSDLLHRVKTRMRVEGGYDGAVAALDGPETATPESPIQAERDVHAALAGDQSAASRVNAVLNSITAEQLAGKAPLTPEQASALSQLQAQQHGMSIDALSTAEQRLGDQREMIANSWQLMSNPALAFPRTELKPGAVQGTDMVKGGEAQLPKNLQGLNWAWPAYLPQLDVIAKIMKAGNPAFQVNTDLDRRMIRHAAKVMDLLPWQRDLEITNVHQSTDEIMGSVVGNIFRAVSPDHPVVHDMVTGSEGKAFLDNMSRHFWSDGGKSAASLFNWVEGAACGPEAKLAAETAKGYGLYLGEHGADLLSLRGGHSMGEVNPQLVRSMAHGLTPYISNIAGIPGGSAVFGDFHDSPNELESGKMPFAKRVFSVLSTDKEASDYFNGAADREALIAEAAYARELATHATNLSSYNENLHNAMTLRGLVNLGIDSATRADTVNHTLSQDAAQQTAYDHRKSAYEAAARAITGVVGLVPDGGSIIGTGLGVLAIVAEKDFLGPAPTASSPSDYSMPYMSIGAADREILNAVIASGQQVTIEPNFLIDGRIGTPDELASRNPNLTSAHYDHALNEALTDLFAQDSGSAAGRPFMPDQDMMNRYNQFAKDSSR